MCMTIQIVHHIKLTWQKWNKKNVLIDEKGILEPSKIVLFFDCVITKGFDVQLGLAIYIAQEKHDFDSSK